MISLLFLLAVPSAFALQFDFLPAPSSSGFRNSSLSSWGGGVVFADGLYHLFASAFLNGCGLGSWGSNSMAIHATSSSPEGPFAFVERALPYYHHNVYPIAAPDGTFLIFSIGMVPDPVPSKCSDPPPLLTHGFESIEAWSSTSVNGPWEPVAGNVNGRNLFNGTNPAPAFDPSNNGTIYVMSHNNGAMTLSIAPHWSGPYSPPFPLFSYEDGNYVGEDPFLWWDANFKNREGGVGAWRVLYHMYDSTDTHHQFAVGGYAESSGASIYKGWVVQSYTTPAYTTNITSYVQGSSGPSVTTTMARRERPKLHFDPVTGEPKVLYTGVCPQGSDTCFTSAVPIAGSH